jgi:3-hydroxymyristoyl/3-hydroxydecanoyl-(acyl carrier protein) dehydratase
MLVSSDMRFRSPVAPPTTIKLEAKLIRSMGPLHLLEVSATVDGTCCADGTIGLMVENSPEETDC